jgi:hypothetical protein
MLSIFEAVILSLEYPLGYGWGRCHAASGLRSRWREDFARHLRSMPIAQAPPERHAEPEARKRIRAYATSSTFTPAAAANLQQNPAHGPPNTGDQAPPAKMAFWKEDDMKRFGVLLASAALGAAVASGPA